MDMIVISPPMRLPIPVKVKHIPIRDPISDGCSARRASTGAMSVISERPNATCLKQLIELRWRGRLTASRTQSIEHCERSDSRNVMCCKHAE